MPDDFEDEETRDDEDVPCRRASDRLIAGLRNELDTKHQQNRRDIHAVRNEQQKLLLEFTVLKTQLMPLMDNGQPGLITKLTTKVDALLRDQNKDDGRRMENDYVRDGIKALIIGIVLALVTHFWK